MNVFVSYTQQDGMVTVTLLRKLNEHLSGICNPFIHAIAEQDLTFQQLGVLRALLRSDVILLLVSPAAGQSKWVLLELLLARLLFRPVIKLNATDLAAWNAS